MPQNYPALSGIGTRATAVGFNGTDLLVGDPDVDSAGSSGAFNFASTGGIDVVSSYCTRAERQHQAPVLDHHSRSEKWLQRRRQIGLRVSRTGQLV